MIAATDDGSHVCHETMSCVGSAAPFQASSVDTGAAAAVPAKSFGRQLTDAKAH